MSDRSEVETLVEIETVAAKLGKTPNDFSLVCRLASLHLDDNKLIRSKPHADHALALYKGSKSTTLKQGLELSDMLVKFWKHDKTLNTKHDLRINFGEERAKVLTNLEDIVKQLVAKKDSEYAHLVSLKMAYVKECKGEFQSSLTLLSELIAAQATDNVDLSYIIFKGAILLKHVGQPKQCIEYLEFIMDDPPVSDGFAKVHVAAFLTHTYESSGDKYKVFLPKAYKDLQEAFAEDMSAASHKLMRSLGKGNFAQNSEIWELLAVQALEKCEYVLATEFLSEAISKAPGKSKLLHLLAEVYTLLKQTEQAVACAEEAYTLSPQSGELRNLLLQIAPAVWTEKLRVMVATTSIPVEGEDEAFDITDPYAPPHHDVVQHHEKPEIIPMNSTGQGVYLSADKEIAAEEASNSSSWLNRMKSKASDALKSINSGTPLITVKSPGQAAKSPLPSVPSDDGEHAHGAGINTNASGSGDAEEDIGFSPTKKEKERKDEKVSPKNAKQKTSAQKVPKASAKNIISPEKRHTTGAHAHSTGTNAGAGDETLQADTGSARPKSRGFVSMLLSSASAAAAAASSATSAAATATANTMASMSGKISPEKSRPPSANKKNEAKTTSAVKNGTAASGAPKIKKITKYDTNVHKSKLSTEEGVGTKKMEKPQLSAEEKKLLELVLAGNENVHIYDPNLQVLHNFRASQNKK